jgi:lysophospholipase L1-like esterase
LIWAGTTPVMVAGKPQELNPDINPIILEHNSLAAKVVKENHLEIDDLYALMLDKRQLARGDIAHWKPEGYEVLGKQVAKVLQKALQSPKPAATSQP